MEHPAEKPDPTERPGEAEQRAWIEGLAVKGAALAGAVLALARFIGYLDTVGDADAAAWAYMSWWSAWAAGVAFLAAGAARGDRDASTAALLVFLGIVTLLLGTEVPVGGFSFNFPF